VLADRVLSGWALPAWASRTGFRLLDPVKSMRSRIDLIMRLHDREALLPREGQRRFLEAEGWAAGVRAIRLAAPRAQVYELAGPRLSNEFAGFVSRFDQPPGGQYTGWHIYLNKDLRTLLGERVRGTLRGALLRRRRPPALPCPAVGRAGAGGHGTGRQVRPVPVELALQRHTRADQVRAGPALHDAALRQPDEAVIPIDMKSVDALSGAEELIATAQALEEDAPKITALVRNRVEGSRLLRRRVFRAIESELGELGLPVAATLIPARDAFEHAAIRHGPLVALEPDDTGSEAFRQLARELEAAA